MGEVGGFVLGHAGHVRVRQIVGEQGGKRVPLLLGDRTTPFLIERAHLGDRRVVGTTPIALPPCRPEVKRV
jgi:hypothetical protein